MIIDHKFYVGLRDINSKLELTNTGILACLEDVACMHSELAGYGIFDREKTKIIWLLLNWKVEILKRPLFNDIITVQTWSRGMDRYYAYRDFKVLDKDNNIIIKATSKWICIDTEKRKPSKISKEINDAYFPEDIQIMEDSKMEKLMAPQEFIDITNYKITKNLIDVNNHLHNIYYMDIAEEALPDGFEENNCFNKFEIMYKKEVKFGEDVKALYSELNNDHYVVIKSEDETNLHAIVKFY